MKTLEARITALEQKVLVVSVEVLQLKESMDANTIALKEYIEISKQLKVGMKLLGYVEATAVWITKFSAAVGIVWAMWKYLILESVEQVLKK